MKDNSIDIKVSLFKLFDVFIDKINKGDFAKNIDTDEGGPKNYLFTKILNEVDKVFDSGNFEYGPNVMVFDDSSFEEKGIPRKKLLEFFINEKAIIKNLRPSSEEFKEYRELLLERIHLLVGKDEEHY